MYAKNLIATLNDLETPLPDKMRAMFKKQARQMFDSFMILMDRQDESIHGVEQFIQQYQNPTETVVRENLNRAVHRASDALDTLIALGKIKFGTNSAGERTVSLVEPVEQTKHISFSHQNGEPYAAIA